MKPAWRNILSARSTVSPAVPAPGTSSMMRRTEGGFAGCATRHRLCASASGTVCEIGIAEDAEARTAGGADCATSSAKILRFVSSCSGPHSRTISARSMCGPAASRMASDPCPSVLRPAVSMARDWASMRLAARVRASFTGSTRVTSTPESRKTAAKAQPMAPAPRTRTEIGFVPAKLAPFSCVSSHDAQKCEYDRTCIRAKEATQYVFRARP